METPRQGSASITLASFAAHHASAPAVQVVRPRFAAGASYGLGGHLDLSDAGPDGAVTVAESDRIRRSLRAGSALPADSARVAIALVTGCTASRTPGSGSCSGRRRWSIPAASAGGSAVALRVS